MQDVGQTAFFSDYPLTRENGGWYAAARKLAGEDATPDTVPVTPADLKHIFDNRVMGTQDGRCPHVRVQVTPEGTWYRGIGWVRKTTGRDTGSPLHVEVFDPTACGPEEEYDLAKSSIRKMVDAKMKSVPTDDTLIKVEPQMWMGMISSDTAHGKNLTHWESREEGEPSVLARLEALSVACPRDTVYSSMPALASMHLTDTKDGRIRVESTDTYRLMWDTLPNPWKAAEGHLPSRKGQPKSIDATVMDVLIKGVRRLHGKNADQTTGLSVHRTHTDKGGNTQMVAGQVSVSFDNGRWTFPKTSTVFDKKRDRARPWVAMGCEDLENSLARYHEPEKLAEGQKPQKNKTKFTPQQSGYHRASIRRDGSSAQVTLHPTEANSDAIGQPQRTLKPSTARRADNMDDFSLSFSSEFLRDIAKFGQKHGSDEVRAIPYLTDGAPSPLQPCLWRLSKDSSAKDRGVLLMPIRSR